jgi:hypothetical protein
MQVSKISASFKHGMTMGNATSGSSPPPNLEASSLSIFKWLFMDGPHPTPYHCSAVAARQVTNFSFSYS